ncbi:hypothetical protein [Rufibacter roseolus]|uniref:hypothetical protein n=1 Tax=Rufibacter roseolus TaxID=2817375 RepID=UPI001B3136CC|nr:hypothetical protein [Rufibacter roseolus]
MKIYLIASVEFDTQEFNKVLEILQTTSGLITFINGNDVVKAAPKKAGAITNRDANSYSILENQKAFEANEPVAWAPWADFFSYCNDFRQTYQVEPSDFLVFLTPHPNHRFYFTAFDDTANNLFIHTDGWEEYLTCRAAFPVSYLIMSQVLQKMLYKHMAVKDATAHHQAKGCTNDYCKNKEDIILKLRTADICPTCLKEMLHAKIKEEHILQALSLFEEVRKEMLFKQRYSFNLSPRKMHITGNKGRKKGIVIKLFEINKEIELDPKKAMVFLTFLNHPEGLRYSHFKRTELRNELEYLYRNMNDRENQEVVRTMVDKFAEEKSYRDPVLSRLRTAFTKVLGTELAKDYLITGGQEQDDLKKINLNRDLVSFDPSVTRHILGDYYQAPYKPSVQPGVSA